MPRTLRRLVVAASLGTLVLPATGLAGIKKMFVTSKTGSGNLSTWADTELDGIAGADQVCQALAAQANLDNPLDYRAWLSDSSDDAYCRIAGLSGRKSNNCGLLQGPKAGPFQRVDGVPFAFSLYGLTTSGPLSPPLVDELQAEWFGEALTGTNFSGALSDLVSICTDWQDDGSSVPTQGLTFLGLSNWTETHPGLSSHPCGASLFHLYCFESGVGDPFIAFERDGLYLFATQSTGNGNLATWTHSGGVGGLQGARNVCAYEEGQARLPGGPYEPLLGTSGHGGQDVIPPGRALKNVYGVEIAPDREQLFSATGPDSIIADGGAWFAANGEPIPPNGTNLSRAWTGIYPDGSPSFADCTGWTDFLTSSGDYGLVGTVGAELLWNSAPIPCADLTLHLFCVATTPVLVFENFESGDVSKLQSVP